MFAEETVAERRFKWRFAPPMAVYTLLLMVTPRLIDGVYSTWAKVLLAFLPLLPLIWAMAEFVRHASGMDEMQRRLHFEAGGVAGMLTCFLVFCWGVVELRGVSELAGLPQLHGVAILPLFCVIYLFHYWKTRRQIG